MNLNKHLEFIQPTKYAKEIHIIGVGAVGSRVAEVLVRLGFDNINIYDFDVVEDVNITNQLYTYEDLGMPKTEALTRALTRINPHLVLKTHGAYEAQPLKGAVFLCVDSIVTRRNITEEALDNMSIDFISDMRMRLTDGQVYAADWKEPNQQHILLNSMQFEDKDDLTPVSVCGTTLSVAPTILTLVSLAIMNFIKFVKKEPIHHAIFVDLGDTTLIPIVYKN